jgi:hypothetical protein
MQLHILEADDPPMYATFIKGPWTDNSYRPTRFKGTRSAIDAGHALDAVLQGICPLPN